MLKNHNFLPVIKSSDVVTFMTLFNTSFHEKVKLGTMYHSKTPQDIKDNIMFFSGLIYCLTMEILAW